MRPDTSEVLKMEEIDPIKLAEEDCKVEFHFRDEQIEMVNALVPALERKGTVFVGQGPTGMGKTAVIVAATKVLNKKGKRVLLVTPSYDHLYHVMKKECTKFNVELAILEGSSRIFKNGHGCPLINDRVPHGFFCNHDKQSSEECLKMDCQIQLQMRTASKSKNVGVVFQKILTSPEIVKDFDAVIIDESHGMEQALRSARICILGIEELDKIIKKFPEVFAELNQVKEAIERLKGRETVPVAFVEKRIGQVLKDVTEKQEVKDMLTNPDADVRSIDTELYKLDFAKQAFTEIDKYSYLMYENSIIARPERMTFAPMNSQKLGKNKSFALISATIENPRMHMIDAGFPFHSLAPPVQVNHEKFRKWFANRPIVGLTSGPILRYNPSKWSDYMNARKEANNIIADCLKVADYPSLVLCRSKKDQKLILDGIGNHDHLKKRIYQTTDEDELLEVDLLSAKVNNEIKSGRNIILTSASSKLWEGANIEKLRMVIIDALPYPQFDPAEKKHVGPWKTSRAFRFMIRRLQQGIGRIARQEGDWGMAVVIDGRFNAYWGMIGSVLPVYMKNVNFENSRNISQFINRRISQLAQANKE